MYYDLIESGKRIKALRKKAGLKQRELAEMINTSDDFISMLETGKSGTSIDTMGMIAEALGSTVDYIAFGRVTFGGYVVPEDKVEMVMGVLEAMVGK